MTLKSLALTLILLQSSCFLPYVIEQGYYQADLLCGAQSVDQVLISNALSTEDRNKLLLVTVLKRFSISELNMLPSKNYTTINPTWSRDLNVVSASQPLAFEPYLWSFPIVGDVPYLGFFNKQGAIDEENRLNGLGYDTMRRAVAGYSTIGYFNDPIWPQMLKRSVYSLSELIIHELAHSTLYFKNQTDFNESFANFVGKIGALQFLQRNFGSHSMELYDAILKNEDDLLYLSWLNTIHDRLNQIYTNVKDEAVNRSLKEQEIQKANLSFKRLEFRSRDFRMMPIPEINNAFLLMSRRYNRAQGDFEKLYVGLGSDWGAFFKELEKLRDEKLPFDALRKLAARYDLGES